MFVVVILTREVVKNLCNFNDALIAMRAINRFLYSSDNSVLAIKCVILAPNETNTGRFQSDFCTF